MAGREIQKDNESGMKDGSSPTWRVDVGDVRERIETLAHDSVQCLVTSPPYWGLRDYGMAGQFGHEDTSDGYVASLVELFGQARRCLRTDGTLWLNLGDGYNAYNGGAGPGSKLSKGAQTTQRPQVATGFGLKDKTRKPKDLLALPWRVALALQADGWFLRADIIWSKPNPMPESVQDRPTKAHEYLFLLSKNERYYYDADAIAELAAYPDGNGNVEPYEIPGQRAGENANTADSLHKIGPRPTRNARSVWTIPVASYAEAHFATFPIELPERCIKAGSKLGDLIVDIFCGSGTTGEAAIRNGRSFVGFEINPAYAELSRRRLGSAAPLFAVEE